MASMTANYANCFGKSEVNQKQNLKFGSTIRLVRNGNVLGERCPKCSGYRLTKKGIRPNLQKEFSHKKGCELG